MTEPTVIIETTNAEYIIALEQTHQPKPMRANPGGLPDPPEAPEYEIDLAGSKVVDLDTSRELPITRLAETIADAAWNVLHGESCEDGDILGGYVE